MEPLKRPDGAVSLICLGPRGAPSPGASWSDLSAPALYWLFEEDDKAWRVRPTRNAMCPIITMPKFAWEEIQLSADYAREVAP